MKVGKCDTKRSDDIQLIKKLMHFIYKANEKDLLKRRAKPIKKNYETSWISIPFS
jgi:hypothetical protein